MYTGIKAFIYTHFFYRKTFHIDLMVKNSLEPALPQTLLTRLSYNLICLPSNTNSIKPSF